MRRSKIPTEEEFKQASAEMKTSARGLSEVREVVISRIQRKHNVHDVFVIDGRNETFRALVFFETEADKRAAQAQNVTSYIRSMILEELERVGRDTANGRSVIFEFDSHENVERNYQGDYFLRLR